MPRELFWQPTFSYPLGTLDNDSLACKLYSVSWASSSSWGNQHQQSSQWAISVFAYL